MRLNLPVTQHNYDYPADELLVSTTNLKGEITHCNGAFQRVSGFDMAELLGQPHSLIRHPRCAGRRVQGFVAHHWPGPAVDGIGKKPPQKWRSLLGAGQRHAHHARRQTTRIPVGAHQTHGPRN